jgi:hypothetical protein
MAVVRGRVGEFGAAWQKRGEEQAPGGGSAQGYATIGAIGAITNLAARLSGPSRRSRCWG